MKTSELLVQKREEIIQLALDSWKEGLYLNSYDLGYTYYILVDLDTGDVFYRRDKSLPSVGNSICAVRITEENIMDWWMEMEYGEHYTRNIESEEQERAIAKYIDEYIEEVEEIARENLSYIICEYVVDERDAGAEIDGEMYKREDR